MCSGLFHFAVPGTSRQGLQGTKSRAEAAEDFVKQAGDAFLRRQHVVPAESHRFPVNLYGPPRVLIKHMTGFPPRRTNGERPAKS
jgi:hypothetical protein